jgi:hypothetical protein
LFLISYQSTFFSSFSVFCHVSLQSSNANGQTKICRWITYPGWFARLLHLGLGAGGFVVLLVLTLKGRFVRGGGDGGGDSGGGGGSRGSGRAKTEFIIPNDKSKPTQLHVPPAEFLSEKALMATATAKQKKTSSDQHHQDRSSSSNNNNLNNNHHFALVAMGLAVLGELVAVLAAAGAAALVGLCYTVRKKLRIKHREGTKREIVLLIRRKTTFLSSR